MTESVSAPDILQRAGVSVLQRGWLSSNNVLVIGKTGPTALVDTGYCTHAPQTLALLESALGPRSLDLLLNTHLHSDHCGGNAAVQERYPDVSTHIPPGQADAVAIWDPVELTFEPTGQECPRFRFDALLQPSTQIRLGDWTWEIHGAKGHDPHSVILFQPDHSILISADALWQNGFGVVFPELEGEAAFEEVRETIDLIERISPKVVIPGHGAVFTDVQPAIERARTRLDRFIKHPEQHLRHAQKVLIKFRLLDWQTIERTQLLLWAMKTPYLQPSLASNDPEAHRIWLDGLLVELENSRALRVDGNRIVNT